MGAILNKRFLLYLALILIVSLGIFYRAQTVGVGICRDRMYLMDEPGKVSLADEVQKSIFIKYFKHPHLFINTLALWELFINKIDFLKSPDFPYLGIYYGRIYQVILGGVIIFIVFLTGKRLIDFNAGLWAAYFYAFCPMAVANTAYLKEDVLMVLSVSLAFLASIIILKREKIRYRDIFLFAVCSTLPVATKYIGIVFLFINLSIFIFKVKGYPKKHLFLYVGVFFLSAIISFIIFNPSIVVYPREFIGGFLDQWRYANTGHRDGVALTFLDYKGMYYLIRSILPGMGFLLAAGSLIGLVIAPSYKKACFLLWIYAVPYYLLLELSRAKPWPFYSRLVHPIIPILCISGAFCLSLLFRSVKDIRRPILIRVFCVVFLSGIIINPILVSTRSIYLDSNDTRKLAEEWMSKQPGNNVYFYTSERYARYFPYPPGGKYNYYDFGTAIQSEANGQAYIVVSSYDYGRYFEVPWKNQDICKGYSYIFENAVLIKEFTPPVFSFTLYSPRIAFYKYPYERKESYQ